MTEVGVDRSLPPNESILAFEFEFRKAVTDMQAHGLDMALWNWVKNAKMGYRLDFYDENITYGLRTEKMQPFFDFEPPQSQLLVVVDTVKGEAQALTEVELASNENAKPTLSQHINFRPQSFEQMARTLKVASDLAELSLGGEIHSDPPEKMTWDSRKLWVGLEEIGVANRYKEARRDCVYGGFLRWHFIPTAERGRRLHR